MLAADAASNNRQRCATESQQMAPLLDEFSCLAGLWNEGMD